MDLTSAKTYLIACFEWVRSHVAKILSAIVFLLIVYYGLFVIEPLNMQPDEKSDNIAGLWSKAIEKLGISPLFPPQEEFYVGDIWAVASENDRLKSSVDVPLLRKAVRIGHIDLSGEKLSVRGPIFTDTVPGDKDHEYVQQTRDQIPPDPYDGKFRLSLVAFPRFTISTILAKKASIAAKLFNIGSIREEFVVDELRITTAETYGVTAGAAFGELMKWCSDSEHQLLCSDPYIRSLFGFAMAGDLPPGEFRTEIRLITRAYLMRRIEQKRFQSSSIGAGGTMAALGRDDADPDDSPKSADTGADKGNATSTPTATAAKLPSNTVLGGGKTSGASSASGRMSDFELNQTFQRPIVFGFRYVAFRPKAPDKSEAH